MADGESICRVVMKGLGPKFSFNDLNQVIIPFYTVYFVYTYTHAHTPIVISEGCVIMLQNHFPNGAK